MSACVEWSTSDADSIKYAPVWSPRPPNADGTDRWELFPDKLVNETRKVCDGGSSSLIHGGGVRQKNAR